MYTGTGKIDSDWSDKLLFAHFVGLKYAALVHTSVVPCYATYCYILAKSFNRLELLWPILWHSQADTRSQFESRL